MKQEHLDRMVLEAKELHEKMDKLNSFIVYAPEYGVLPIEQQGMLTTQHACMKAYHAVLALRIGTANVEG